MAKMTWLFGGIAIYLIVTLVVDIYGEGRDFSEQDHMHSDTESYLHKDIAEVRTEEIEDSQPTVSQAKHLSGSVNSSKTTAKSNEVVNETSSAEGGEAGSVSGMTGWYLPLDGQVVVTSDYGGRSYFHSGVDLGKGGNPDGEPIKVVAPGKVTKVAFMQLPGGSGPTGYGYYAEIEHDVQGEKHFSIYAHMKSMPKLSVGQTVNAGDTVGIMGNTGCGSCGRHLHLEIGYKDDAGKSKYKSRNEEQHIKRAPAAWWWKNSANWVRSNPKNYFKELKGKGSGATVTRQAKAPSGNSSGAIPTQ